MDATPEELEAVRLRFHKLNPDVSEAEVPTPDQAKALLLEVRGRAAAIEQDTFKMLMQASHNQASRSGMNSKYMQLLWGYVLVPAVALALLVTLFTWLFRHR